MNIYEISPAATTFLAEYGDRFAGHGWNPWFLLIPLTQLPEFVGIFRGHGERMCW